MTESQAAEAGTPTPAAPKRRSHTIVLCCAKSVEAMVQEVARNLDGLGYPASVACGSRARDAIIGIERQRTEPTIYVLCVQDPLKETVLKPLRQALAEHGGPDEHLLVAVLDLSLPLSMVTKIRRYVDGLNRAPEFTRKDADALAERHRIEESLGEHQRKRIDTHNYRTLRLVERGNREKKVQASPAALRTSRVGPRIRADVAPTRVLTTQKYRAVTGALPAEEQERRARNKTQLYKRRKENSAYKTLPPDIETKTVVQPKPTSKPKANGPGRKAAPRSLVDPDEEMAPPPSFATLGAAVETKKSSNRFLWIFTGMLAAGIAMALLLWEPDTRKGEGQVAEANVGEPEPVDRSGSADADASGPVHRSGSADADASGPVHRSGSADADASGPESEPEPVHRSGSADADASGPVHRSGSADADASGPVHRSGSADADASGPESEPEPVHRSGSADADTSGPVHRSGSADADTSGPDHRSGSADADASGPVHRSGSADADTSGPEPETLTGDDAVLAAAVAAHRLAESKRLYVARLGEDNVDWKTASKMCRKYDVDGVKGWRLAYRRELKSLGVARLLPQGTVWSRTEDEADPEFAFVYSTKDRSLITFLKAEATSKVVCVNRKNQ